MAVSPDYPMYNPRHNKIEDSETLQKFVSEFNFATLISPGPEDLRITHLPLLYEPSDGGGIINGHMAKANDHWRVFDEVQESVAVFHGPDAYVSSGWYESNLSVPTWNYAVVHMRGPVRVVENAEWLSEHVDQLLEFHEAKLPYTSAVSIEKHFKEKLLNAIVGFRMTVERTEGKFKLSQNRSDADQQRVAENLEKLGDPRSLAMSEMMRMHNSVE